MYQEGLRDDERSESFASFSPAARLVMRGTLLGSSRKHDTDRLLVECIFKSLSFDKRCSDGLAKQLFMSYSQSSPFIH
jgi:hypothetical protein